MDEISEGYNLLDFLKDSDNRENLKKLLAPYQIQSDLFVEDKRNFDLILDEIGNLYKEEKPLYQRWVKENNGKRRLLSIPKKPLRKFFDEYLLDFIKKKPVHQCCHGGERNWSPRKSLEMHLPCESMFSFDLESAFENINSFHVFEFFYKNLEHTNYDVRRDLADFLTTLCTVSYDGKIGLPQGSPHSMALFNRMLFSLDETLDEKSKERKFTYSRWVDDMHISSKKDNTVWDFLGAIEIVQRIFPIAKKKLYFQENRTKIYVMGHIISNENILKNNKEEVLKNKIKPLVFSDYFAPDKKKVYTSW